MHMTVHVTSGAAISSRMVCGGLGWRLKRASVCVCHLMPACATSCLPVPPHACLCHLMPVCATSCLRVPPHATACTAWGPAVQHLTATPSQACHDQGMPQVGWGLPHLCSSGTPMAPPCGTSPGLGSPWSTGRSCSSLRLDADCTDWLPPASSLWSRIILLAAPLLLSSPPSLVASSAAAGPPCCACCCQLHCRWPSP